MDSATCKLSSCEISIKEHQENENTDACRIPQRYILCAFAFLGLAAASCQRNHLGVTILAMNNSTENSNLSVDTLEWDNIKQGFFLGAYFYGYTLGNFPGGLLVKIFGFRNVLSISMFLSGVLDLFVPICAWNNFYLALVVRAITGFLQGSAIPATTEIWTKWAPPIERSMLVAITLSGVLFGFIISLPLAALVISYFQWEANFYFTGGISMVWSVVFAVFITETPETNSRISEQEKFLILEGQQRHKVATSKISSVPWRSIFSSRCVYALFACHFADAWYQLVIPAVFPTYMVKALHFEVVQSGFAIMVPFILQFCVVLIVGRLTSLAQTKWNASTTFVRKFNSCLGVGLAGLLAAVSGYGGEDRNVVVGIFTIGFALSGSTYSGYLSNALDFAPDYTSVIMGISNSMACSSGFLGPMVAAYIVNDQESLAEWQTFFWVTCGISCFGSVIFGLLGSGKRQKWNKPSELITDENQNKIRSTLLTD